MVRTVGEDPGRSVVGPNHATPVGHGKDVSCHSRCDGRHENVVSRGGSWSDFLSFFFFLTDIDFLYYIYLYYINT